MEIRYQDSSFFYRVWRLDFDPVFINPEIPRGFKIDAMLVLVCNALSGIPLELHANIIQNMFRFCTYKSDSEYCDVLFVACLRGQICDIFDLSLVVFGLIAFIAGIVSLVKKHRPVRKLTTISRSAYDMKRSKHVP